MNDQLSGQLTANWIIPEYARECLWLETDTGDYQVEGPFGLFTLDAPCDMLTLRWGAADGPALARLPWRVDNLGWSGKARVGGYVDAIHITEVQGVAHLLAVIYMGGQPLKPDVRGYPGSASRRSPPYPVPNFYAGLAAEVQASVSTWLVSDQSPLAAMADQALLNNLRLHFYGQLAEEGSVWSQHFALPLLLQAVTLFGE